MSEIIKDSECSELSCSSLLEKSCHEENVSSSKAETSKMTNIKSSNIDKSYLPCIEKTSKSETFKETVNHVTFRRVFKVFYLGYAVLDRRYTQPMLPWLIAEIKRHGLNNEEQIFIEITEQSLKAVKCETNAIIFEHKLQSVSKFAQSTLDSSCFTYMTREVVSGPSAYHVFQANDENTVLQLFTAIREVSKEMSNQQNIASFSMKTASGVSLDSVIHSCRQYEVLYVGRIKVSGKKAPPNFIDETVEKFRVYELEKAKNHNSFSKRRRHGSGASVSSLPQSFEMFKKPNENELQKQIKTTDKEDLSSSNGVSSCESICCKSLDTQISCDINPLLQSPLSPICNSDNTYNFPGQSQCLMSHSQSMDISIASQTTKNVNYNKSNSLIPPSSLITHTQSLDAPACVDIVRDLRDSDPSVKLRDRVRSCSGDIPRTKQTSLPAYYHYEGCVSDVQRPRAYTSPFPSDTRQSNRTMLFLIGRLEICLIGTDKKQMLLSKTFSDIAHCSQGVRHLDHFGFICRETTLSGADCYSGYIFRCQTEKVVDEMMQTLKQAFSQAHQHYQKLPSTKSSLMPKIFICDACPMHWFHRLCCDVEGISAEEAHLVILEKLGTLPDEDKEEIIMKFQKVHNEDVQEQNEVLMMLLRGMAEQKQITHTHVSSSSTGKNELTPMKEKTSKLDSFREKARKSLSSSFETFMKLTNRDEGKDSSTLIHNNQPLERKLSSVKDVDTRSYRESSCDNDRYSSGQISPVSSRPRSSTFTSSREAVLSVKKNSRQETLHSRPIMNVLTKTGNQNKNSSQTQIYESPKGSWRQAIFHRVQTPGRGQNQGDQHVLEIDGRSPLFSSKVGTKKTKEELRALWKKAIIEQILLIRMEKENRKLQVNQDAACHKRMKLDYEEVTPCIKLTVINWEEILNDPKRNIIQMDKGKLTDIVKAGVPRHKRGEIWLFLAEQYRHFQTQSDGNEKLNIPYEELLKQLTSHQHSILIDIGRTFPNHPFYSQTLGSGQLSLFNLLKAYSLLDQEVGYCQGLSFVAGILLLHMSEEQAFSMMKFLMFDLSLRRQYKTDMVAFQVQMYQLSRLIHDNYRDLYEHLVKYDIAPTLYAAPWFLTLFASQFPIGFVSRLFDLIFLYGMDVIFKISLVLLGNYKESIIMCDSFESTMNFLKTELPSIDVLQMEIIFTQVFSLDISRQLHAYEVEYYVLMEEMAPSPSKNSVELENLQTSNKALKAQNMELVEQLQVAYSRIHSLEASGASLKSTVTHLEKRVAALEDEKEALVNSLHIMKSRLERLEVSKLEISEEHPPSFATVYALAGSEREEDKQFQALMKDFCQIKEKESKSIDSRIRLESPIQEDDIEENDVFEEPT